MTVILFIVIAYYLGKMVKKRELVGDQDEDVMLFYSDGQNYFPVLEQDRKDMEKIRDRNNQKK